MFNGDGAHRFALGGRGPATLQRGESRQRLVNTRRNEFTARGPFEDVPKPAHLVIDGGAAPSRLDHLGAHDFECERAEVASWGSAIQASNDAQRTFERGGLAAQ